jgi:Uma2 family endonuclease
MFIYFSAERVFGRDFRGPDFFVVKGVDRNRPRVSWVVWDEKGKTPDVIVELLSPTTAAVDRGPKKLLYESVFRTREYYCYEPSTDRLEAWRLATGAGYQPISPDASGRLWSEELELALGTWDGAYEDTHARWVRFFKADGTLVPTSLEASQAENERLRKENEVLRKQQVPPPTP